MRSAVATLLLTMTAAVSIAPTTQAEPEWPSAGDQSAAATIADFEAQGYNVAINWVGGGFWGHAPGQSGSYPHPFPATS